jgi:DNA uptake protein ComE-like DNA-binding protein
MLHVFEWPELVTDGVIAAILDAAGIPVDPTPDWMTAYLASVFEAQARLPLIEGHPDSDALTRIASGLFLRALQSASSEFGFTRTRNGLYLRGEDGDGPFERTAFAFARVSANTGTFDDLEALPVIGSALAQRILDERRTAGVFTSLEDLKARVTGFGPKLAEALSDLLTFDTLPSDAGLTPPDLELRPLLRRLLSRIDRSDQETRLRVLLDHLAASANRAPPPLPRAFEPLQADLPPEFDEVPIESAGVLSGSDYYFRLQELIADADTSVLVLMFHAALPDDGHPTKKLLTALVEARARGLDVRVILDRDRDTDPYKSTVINTAALTFLNEQGVPCRFDSPERLLHTKLVILDGRWSLVGSHNWSAGSYFQFDDLTLAVHSEEVAQRYEQRFEAAWLAAE